MVGVSKGMLWMGVSQGVLPDKYYHSNKDSLRSVELHGDHMTVIEMRWIWPPPV